MELTLCFCLEIKKYPQLSSLTFLPFTVLDFFCFMQNSFIIKNRNLIDG